MLHLHYKYEAQALKLEAYAFISTIDLKHKAWGVCFHRRYKQSGWYLVMRQSCVITQIAPC